MERFAMPDDNSDFVEESKLRREKREKMRQQLAKHGEPDLLVSTANPSNCKEQTGFWWVSGGIISYKRKDPDAQWNMKSRKEYPDSLLASLWHLLANHDPRSDEDLISII